MVTVLITPWHCLNTYCVRSGFLARFFVRNLMLSITTIKGLLFLCCFFLVLLMWKWFCSFTKEGVCCKLSRWSWLVYYAVHCCLTCASYTLWITVCYVLREGVLVICGPIFYEYISDISAYVCVVCIVLLLKIIIKLIRDYMPWGIYKYCRQSQFYCFSASDPICLKECHQLHVLHMAC